MMRGVGDLPESLRWLFWDVDCDGLDPIAQADAVLARVLENGRLEDVRAILALYGTDCVLRFFRGEAFGLGLAGLRDLAAMKLAAISRRGLRRDFWDLREILRSRLTLRECCEAYLQRFGVREADLDHVLRALTYFADAEKDPVFPAGLDESGWAAIKAFFLTKAPKLVALGKG